jgi:hypothetical protein
MKDTERDKLAYERMKPGIVTAQGFLGHDERELGAIVAEDASALARAGLDRDDVADALERLREAGGRGMGEPISVAPGLIVQTGDARGVLPCPWGDGTFHKNSVAVRSGDEEFAFSDLSIHLLRVHGFLQGKGSAFRLEPETLARAIAREGMAWKA